mmetsp:Transcript_36210/g.91410  ORF Transcript_36210/g.91410 Transcript_36210/m.91410 type:complete len:896 (+) Transcript_36210:168-2855(+)
MSPDKPLSKWTVAELRKDLQTRGLETKGLKAELITRLQEAIEAGGGAAAPEPTDEAMPTAPASEDMGSLMPSFVSLDGGDKPAAAAMEVDGEKPAAVAEEATPTPAPTPVAAAAPAAEPAAGGPESHPVEVTPAPAEKEAAAEPMQEEPAAAAAAATPAATETTPAKAEPAAVKAVVATPPSVAAVGSLAEPSPTATAAATAAAEARKKSLAELGPEEWEVMELPDSWRPLPLLRISNLPEKVTEDDIDGLMAGAGFPLKSVTLEEGGKSAFMRLAVPKPSAKPVEKAEPPSEEAVKEETMPAAEGKEAAKEAVKEGEGAAKKEEGGEKKEEAEVEIPAADYYNDPDKVGYDVAKKLGKLGLEMSGKKLQIEGCTRPAEQISLYIGNLPHELDSDEAIHTTLVRHGQLERCFVVRSPDGKSKGYAIAEWSLPASAVKAYNELEEISREMRKGVVYSTAVHRVLGSRASEILKPKEEAKPAAEAGSAPEAAPAAAASEDKEGAGEGAAKPADAPAEVKGEEAKPDEAKPTSEEAKPADEEAKPAAEAGAEEAAKTEVPAKSPAKTTSAPTASQANSGKRPFVKPLRAEWNRSCSRESFFGKNLYVANLNQGFQNEASLSKAFSEYGPVKECHIAKNKATGFTKGFAFIEFYHSKSATAAYQALDDQTTNMGKLAVAFSNPAKTTPRIYRSKSSILNAPPPPPRQANRNQPSRYSSSTGSLGSARGGMAGRMGAMGSSGAMGRGAGMGAIGGMGMNGGMAGSMAGGRGTGMMGSMPGGRGMGMMGAQGGMNMMRMQQQQQMMMMGGGMPPQMGFHQQPRMQIPVHMQPQPQPPMHQPHQHQPQQQPMSRGASGGRMAAPDVFQRNGRAQHAASSTPVFPEKHEPAFDFIGDALRVKK